MRSSLADATGLRIAVVGISTTQMCGVRDHASLLTGELTRRGGECSWHWLQRRTDGAWEGRSEVGDWAAALPGLLSRERAQLAVVHYSVFAWAHRGLPLYVHPVVKALRHAGIPILLIIHEAAYPWDVGGLRGKVWAITQRLAMLELVRGSGAVIVTAAFRARWLASRRWLPRRPIRVSPVFSNLPPPGPAVERRAGTIGLFGFGFEGADHVPVIDALAELKGRGHELRLHLLGAPGARSPIAEDWRRAAGAAGIAGVLSFSGPLSAQELSDELAACTLLLSIAAGGPTSRKGSLAGSLASGTPVLVLDGPRRWQEIVDAGAVRLVPRGPGELAGAIEQLLGDPQQMREIGRRGRAFAEGPMGVGQTADAVLELAGGLLA